MSRLTFAISADGPPQKAGTCWRASVAETGQSFVVGRTVPFEDGDGGHRGLNQRPTEIPALHYDRAAASQTFGLWAHFVWPSVSAESFGGHHLTVNTYDRARFTFGFYQLAAHTPNDNLILLFRHLLALPSASDYFPDLLLKDGKVHRQDGGGDVVSLEAVTNVKRPNGKFENQLVGFMSYLNPDTTSVGETEVLNAARLMHWVLHDPAALDAAVAVAMGIMRRKVRAAATRFGLAGREAELAIWVSDIRHQGRGSAVSIESALSKPTHAERLEALFEIDDPGKYLTRRRKVRSSIATLASEGLFAGVRLGDPALPLA